MGRLVTEPLLKLLDKFLVSCATSYRVSGETSGVWVTYACTAAVLRSGMARSREGVRKICSHNGGSGQEVCGLSILVILARRGQIMAVITTACAILVQPPFHAQSSWCSAAPLPVPTVDEGGMGSYRHAISLTASDPCLVQA